MANRFGIIGMVVGATAFMLAVIHFSVGPFSSDPLPDDFQPEKQIGW